MFDIRKQLAKSEIISAVRFEDREQVHNLGMTFGKTAIAQLIRVEPTEIILSGAPDFFTKPNEDGTHSVKRVILPSRHIVVREPMSYIEGADQPCENEFEQDTVKLFRSTNYESELIVGIFGSRLAEAVVEQILREQEQS